MKDFPIDDICEQLYNIFFLEKFYLIQMGNILYVRILNMKKINSFRGDNYFLSNFYEIPVIFHGLTYQNNEAAFQAQKYLSVIEQEQFTNLSASEAKKLGRKVTLRKDWETVKIKLMQEIVKAKFVQHPELAQKLIQTGDAYLEEGNTWGDKIWGTVDGKGANHLGHILMNVRAELNELELEKNSIE